MTSINIAGLTPVEDPSYRYKMPKIIGKVEGRGNGIKTVIMNVFEVGASLNREPGEITKFFGCELGSQTTFSLETERAVVNGSHRDNDLQNHLSRYIENFVLCKNCRLPETHYKIKDGLISQKCLACGNKDSVDMTHKLTAYILAQHKKNKELKKEQEKKEAAAGGGKDKKEKKSDKTDKKEKKVDPEQTDSDKKSKKKSSTKDGEPVGENVFGIVEEDESDSKAADEGMERFKLWFSSNTAATVNQIVEELRSIQTMASLRPADRVIIYLGAQFSEAVITNKEIESHKSVLEALAPSEIQERHLIAAFEWFCGTRYPSLVKYFPVILKQLLDEELVEEDTFFLWAADLTRNEFSAEQSMMCLDTLEQLKNSAAPFIKWLQEAEEEDEDGEDEEDDEEEEEA